MTKATVRGARSTEAEAVLNQLYCYKMSLRAIGACRGVPSPMQTMPILFNGG